MIKFPETYHELDCEGIGYPGVLVTLWVNPPAGREPAPLGAKLADVPKLLGGQVEFYRESAAIVRAVELPEAYGGPERIEIATAHDLYELERRPGFDPLIVAWALREWRLHRLDWMVAAAKNVGSASGTQPG